MSHGSADHQTTVLILEDHAVMRLGLRLLLDSAPGMVVVGEAMERAEALELAARTQPHVILLDLDLQGQSSLEFLPELIQAAGSARVLVLTGSRDAQQHRRAVHLGAVGVVHKEEAPDVLLTAVERVHAGEVWLNKITIAEVLQEALISEQKKRNDPTTERIRSLTEHEREFISFLSEGLSNKQLAERLGLKQTAVRYRLGIIFGKLAVESRLELLTLAYRHGLVRRTT